MAIPADSGISFSFKPAGERLGTASKLPKPAVPKSKAPDPDDIAVLQRAAYATPPQILGKPAQPPARDPLNFAALNEGAPPPEVVRRATEQASQFSEPGTSAFRENFNTAMDKGVLTLDNRYGPQGPGLLEGARRALGADVIPPAVRQRAGEFGEAAGRYTAQSLADTWVGQGIGAAVRPPLRAVGLEPPSAADIGGAVGEFVGEAVVPVDTWEVLVELIPGIGAVPGVGSMGRKALAKALADEGLPATARGVRTLIANGARTLGEVAETPEVQRAIVKARTMLADESGSLRGFGEDVPVGPVDQAPGPVTPRRAISPDMRDADIGAAFARGETLDLSALTDARLTRLYEQTQEPAVAAILDERGISVGAGPLQATGAPVQDLTQGSAGTSPAPIGAAPPVAAAAGGPPPPSSVLPPSAPEGGAAGSLPEVFDPTFAPLRAGRGETPDTTLFRNEAGEQLDVEGAGGRVTYPGGQPIVQGISEGPAPKPPGVGGADIVGRRLDRDAANRIEAFEARAKELGAPDPVIRAVATAYRDGEAFASTARRYTDSNPVRQILAKGQAWVEGNVPDGVVNAIARAHLVAENGIRLHVDDALEPLRRIDQTIEKAKPKLKYIGPDKMRELAEKHIEKAVVIHPEWFAGKSAALKVTLEELQSFQNDLYKVVQAIDPNAAPALDTPYLRSLWDIPESDLTSAVTMPIGRASVTKKRSFPDPFEAMADPKWPYELKQDVPVSELVGSSAHLAARQIGVQLERKMILKRFGTTSRRPGLKPFRNPNYAGWHAKPEIVNFIDQLYEPSPSVVGAFAEKAKPVRSTIFGVGDIGVFGQHVTNLLATRGTAVLAAAINRGLEQMGLGLDLYRYADDDLPRAIQRSLDGLQQGQAGRMGEPGGRTLVGLGIDAVHLPGGKGFDEAVDMLNNAQFAGVLTPLRNMAYEGNLIVDKLLHSVTKAERFDISSPAVRRRAAENASAFSGGSMGALRRSRREGESAFLGAPGITRAMAAELAQVAKLNTPEALTTLVTIGATVYGLGTALNLAFGSGVPVTLDPRNVDWASVTLGGEWKDVNGEKKYVGGHVIRLIPQASLVRAIGKSFAAVEQGKPESFIKAWNQLAFTRATPLLQVPANLLGTGFDDSGHFHTGSLPMQQRLENIAPLPISGQQAVAGEIKSPVDAALAITGVATFPGQTEEQIGEDQREESKKKVEASDLPTLDRGFESNHWQTRLSDLTVKPQEYKTFADFRGAWIDYWVERRPEGVDEEIARDLSTRKFEQLGVIKEMRAQQGKAEDRFWKANPALLLEAIKGRERDATPEHMKILEEAGVLATSGS